MQNLHVKADDVYEILGLCGCTPSILFYWQFNTFLVTMSLSSTLTGCVVLSKFGIYTSRTSIWN